MISAILNAQCVTPPPFLRAVAARRLRAHATGLMECVNTGRGREGAETHTLMMQICYRRSVFDTCAWCLAVVLLARLLEALPSGGAAGLLMADSVAHFLQPEECLFSYEIELPGLVPDKW